MRSAMVTLYLLQATIATGLNCMQRKRTNEAPAHNRCNNNRIVCNALCNGGKMNTEQRQTETKNLAIANARLSANEVLLSQAKEDIEKADTKIELLEQDITDYNKDIVGDRAYYDPKNETYDSMSLTDVADAMRYLSDKGLFVVEKEYGRRIIGKRKEAK